MQIQQFRQLYPQYNGFSDDTIARKIHTKHYSDVDYDEFAIRFGIRKTPAQQIRPEAEALAAAQRHIAKLPPEPGYVPEFAPVEPATLPTRPLTSREMYLGDLRQIYREPGTTEQREEKARVRTRERLWERADEIQTIAQDPITRRRLQENEQELKSKFLNKTYRRWERGEVMVVGGGLYLLNTLSNLSPLRAFPGMKESRETVSEWSRLMHQAMQEPEMQPVVENTFDKYFGGAVETGPFLGAAIGSAALTSGTSIPASVAGFLVAFGVEGNNILQTNLDQGRSERESRMRAFVGGVINGGIEIAGGGGGKYLKAAQLSTIKKLGKARYFGRRVMHTALTEGLREEIPQELVGMVLGGDPPRNPDGSIDYPSVASRLIDAGIMGTIIGGMADVPFSAYGTAKLPQLPKGDVIDIGNGRFAIPGIVYNESKVIADEDGGAVNPWVKQDVTASNAGRTLMIQFNSDLISTDTDPLKKAHDDKLYSTRPGYHRLGDTWEVPKWMGEVSNTVPNSDVYFVRDMAEAKTFLAKSGYDHITFSALDVNRDNIKELAKDFKGEVSIGGYVDLTFFADLKNTKTYDSIQAMAEDRGLEYKPGTDYSHFESSQTIPRLCMSKGCLHKCTFCVVPKGITEMTMEVMNDQADEIAKADATLVYVDDKTFGQAKNHSYLPELYNRIKKKNPEFEGFIIQTTAAQMGKLNDQLLRDAHIKFIEIGVESYNDDILKKLHKPANEKLIDAAADKARRLGIDLIPNVLLSLPQETAETYAHTLAWLRANQDIISHINTNNLALYEGTELAEEIGIEDAKDINENQVKKSFHKDPEMHVAAAVELYKLGNEILDTPLISESRPGTVDEAIGAQLGLTPIQVQDKLAKAEDRYRLLKHKDVGKRSKADKQELAFLSRNRGDIEAIVNDYTSEKPVVRGLWKKPKKPSKKELLRRGHQIPEQLNIKDEERRDLQEMVTGKRTMAEMSKDQMIKWIEYLDTELAARGEVYEEQPEVFPQIIESLTTAAKVPVGRIRKYFRESRLGGLWSDLKRIERWLEALDGYEDGPLHQHIWKRVKQADELRNVNIGREQTEFFRIIEDQNIDSAIWCGAKEKIREGLELTPFEQIGVYLLAQNDNGFKYLTKGMAVTEEDITLIGDKLTEEQLAVAAWLDEQYRLQWPVIRAAAIEAGVDPKLLEQELNYSPILRTDLEDDVDFVSLLTEQFNQQSLKPEKGFLEQRKKRALGKIELDAGIIYMKNIQRIETFKAMAPVAANLGRIFHNPIFKTALNEATEGRGMKIMNTWLRDTVRGFMPGPQSEHAKLISMMRRNGIIYAIGYNIPSVMRQTLSLNNAIALDPLMLKYVPANMLEATRGNYKTMEEFVEERSALVRTREYDRDLKKKWDASALGKRLRGKKPWSEKATNWIRWTDKRTVVTAWKSLYDVALEKKMTEQEAVEFADQGITRTQPMANMKDLPHFFRGGTLERLLSTFQNQVNNNLNFYVHDIVGARIAGKISNTEVAYRVMWSYVIPAILFGIIGRGRLPITEEGINWKALAVDLATYPIATLMLAGRLINRMIRGWGNSGTVGEIAPEEAVRTVQAARRGDIPGMIKHAAATYGAATGRIPAQAIRTVGGAMDLAAGTTRDPRRLIYTQWALDQERVKKPKTRVRKGPASRGGRGGPAGRR